MGLLNTGLHIRGYEGSLENACEEPSKPFKTCKFGFHEIGSQVQPYAVSHLVRPKIIKKKAWCRRFGTHRAMREFKVSITYLLHLGYLKTENSTNNLLFLSSAG